MNAKNLPVSRSARRDGRGTGQSWLVSADSVDMTRPARPLRAARRSRPSRRTSSSMPNKTALVIVDMQNDFCTKGGWLDSRGIDISPNRKPIEPLSSAGRGFRKQSVPVIWVNWGVRKDLLNIQPSLRHAHSPRGDEPGLGEPVPGTRSEVIARGSWGAEVVDEINPGDSDIQIIKHRFSALLGHRDRLDPAQPRRQDAADRRRQSRPVRDDHARGREFPRLRHRS